MAILQLSRITNRKGLSENLPQLAGAEFGWVLDDRKLYIGNGTIIDGAPVIGNTEILTEHSNILELGSTYTYKGVNSAEVVTTDGEGDIVRSITSKFDDFASVKDFGAVGDGITDDTAAINWALFQLFCTLQSGRARRSLYFPAGVYKVTGTILIPPHAKLWGEGISSSIIEYTLDPLNPVTHVAATADINCLSGPGMIVDSEGAPEGIEMVSMSIRSNEDISILLIINALSTSFDHVELKGPRTFEDSKSLGEGTTTIEITGSSRDISFTKMLTSGTTYALRAIDAGIKGVVFENSRLDLHYKGVVISDAGPTGVIITRNIFDNIALQGIEMGNSPFNSSAFNVFYDVGNGLSTSPIAPVISMLNKDCTSIGDQFERDDTDNDIQPRVQLPADGGGIAFDGSHSLKLGAYERLVGVEALLDIAETLTPIVTFNSQVANTFKIDYNIFRDGESRMGTMFITNNASTVEYNEEFTQSADLGIDLSVVQVGITASSTLEFYMTSGNTAIMNYSIVRMD